MSAMGTNRKNEQFIKCMLLFMKDGSDIRGALKICFGGSVRKLKDTLAELGFTHAQYGGRASSSEKHPPKIYEVDPTMNVFPNKELFEKFKSNGNSWFIMERPAVKSSYMIDKPKFATNLLTILRDPVSKKAVIDFNYMEHKTFDFCPGP
jgi:hypothetical protein